MHVHTCIIQHKIIMVLHYVVYTFRLSRDRVHTQRHVHVHVYTIQYCSLIPYTVHTCTCMLNYMLQSSNVKKIWYELSSYLPISCVCRLDNELDLIGTQQQELEEVLSQIETSLTQQPSLLNPQHPDIERSHTWVSLTKGHRYILLCVWM